MTQREAKRRACSIAAQLLWRGGDYPQAIFEVSPTDEDIRRMEAAWRELAAELFRRAAVNPALEASDEHP